MKSKKPEVRTYRLQYINAEGLRCTTFIETAGSIGLEDVTAKTKTWIRYKLRKPSKKDLATASALLASRKPCLSPKCEAGYEICRNCKPSDE